MNWELEEEHIDIMNIIKDSFNPQRTGGQSGEADSQSRNHFGHSPGWGAKWPRLDTALHNLQFVLELHKHCLFSSAIRPNMQKICFQYGIIYISYDKYVGICSVQY